MAARLPAANGHDLFERTVAQLAPRLRRLRTPHQLMGTLRWGAGELDRAYANAPAEARSAVACHEGCASCCHVAVDVQAHEVLFAADHIQVHFSPQALSDALERLDAHRIRVAAFAGSERDQSRQACALLQAGACSIYAGRPQPCRSPHQRCRRMRSAPSQSFGRDHQRLHPSVTGPHVFRDARRGRSHRGSWL